MSTQLPLSKPAQAVRVLRRSERVQCVACGHRHVTTARLPWCALSVSQGLARPAVSATSDASSQRSEGASQGK